MFPQRAEVVAPQRVPPAVICDKSRIKTVHLRRCDNFSGRVRCEWADDVHDECRLEDLEIVHDRLPAHFAGARESRCFEYSAAVDEQHFEQPREGRPLLEPEEFLNILRPVRIQPLLIVAFRCGCREKERREAASCEPMLQARIAERHHVSVRHGREPDLVLSASQRIAKLGSCAEPR